MIYYTTSRSIKISRIYYLSNFSRGFILICMKKCKIFKADKQYDFIFGIMK